MIETLVHYSIYVAIPVLVLHMILDLFDKHRHGIKLHDKLSIFAYVVLAVHFSLDIVNLVKYGDVHSHEAAQERHIDDHEGHDHD